MDADLFSFWPLSRIRPLTEELSDPIHITEIEFAGAADFFCFADYSIHADILSIELGAGPQADVRFSAMGSRFLSVSSFHGSLEVYLKDAYALLR